MNIKDLALRSLLTYAQNQFVRDLRLVCRPRAKVGAEDMTKIIKIIVINLGKHISAA